MRKTRVWITMGCCLMAMALNAGAQSSRKPGLYESTTTMTWQQSPFPPGMQMPQGGNSPFGGGPHTSQVCLTQAMIDKYGAPPPQSRGGCTVGNIQMRPTGMSADWICSGMMTGKGSVETSFTDPGHATTKVHFIGTMTMGQNTRPVEYTMESVSTYKGPDCGSVQPPMMPNH